jgi:hypothetical protein
MMLRVIIELCYSIAEVSGYVQKYLFSCNILYESTIRILSFVR